MNLRRTTDCLRYMTRYFWSGIVVECWFAAGEDVRRTLRGRQNAVLLELRKHARDHRRDPRGAGDQPLRAWRGARVGSGKIVKILRPVFAEHRSAWLNQADAHLQSLKGHERARVRRVEPDGPRTGTCQS